MWPRLMLNVKIRRWTWNFWATCQKHSKRKLKRIQQSMKKKVSYHLDLAVTATSICWSNKKFCGVKGLNRTSQGKRIKINPRLMLFLLAKKKQKEFGRKVWRMFQVTMNFKSRQAKISTRKDLRSISATVVCRIEKCWRDMASVYSIINTTTYSSSWDWSCKTLTLSTDIT